MNNHCIVAKKSPKGIIVKDGDHNNYYQGARYDWSVLLIGRTDIPDDHERDVERQTTNRNGIPFSTRKNTRILRWGYVQS